MSATTPNRVTTTEDVAATPGWVESELDQILADLPRRPTLASARIAYLDCLAGIGGAADVDRGHDRCRGRFIDALREDGIAETEFAALDARLAAMENEITDRT